MPMSPEHRVDDIPLGGRIMVVALVASMHLLVVWMWMAASCEPRPVTRELTVSLMKPGGPKMRASMPRLQSAAPAPPAPPKLQSRPPDPKPLSRRRPVAEQAQIPVDAPVVPVQTDAVTDSTAVSSSLSSSTSAVYSDSAGYGSGSASGSGSAIGSVGENADTEPDYHAAYLNNPVPVYPMIARRMGWEGKVMLKVEVLASGLPGRISVHRSSGHEVLDQAALDAVRGWKFVAARHAGQPITRFFLVPIPFVLQGTE